MNVAPECTHSFRSRLLQNSYTTFNNDEKEEEPASNYNDNFYISVIPPKELTTFAKRKNLSDDQLNSILWCFNWYKWDSAFFAQATSTDKVRFRQILAESCDIRAGVAGTLWLKCIQNNGNNNDSNSITDTLDVIYAPDIEPEENDNDDLYEEWVKCFEQKPNTLNDNIDIVYASDIKQEEDTDLDLSYLTTFLSPSIHTSGKGKLDVLYRINSVEDVAEHLVYNCWAKNEEIDGSYNVKYLSDNNHRSSIRFHYTHYGADKNEKKHKQNGSSYWIGWVKFEGIWTANNVTKRVDIHIHVNVVSRETNVNIELYPDRYSLTGEVYWEKRLEDIGGKINKYVCSEWITNNMIKLLKLK